MKSTPPKWADRFLQWYCHPDALEDIQGDLYELYYHRLVVEGKRAADWKFAWEVFRFFRFINIRNPLSKLTLKDMVKTKQSGFFEGEYTVTSQWNDMLFETRNKAYGAYVVRSDYSRNLLTGFFASMLLLVPIALLMFWVIISSY